MRVDHLRYFHRLAEVLSFTKAAEELYIAQPTLSIAIKRMESELGITLFKRGEGSSRIELTEAGAAFYEYVDHMLNSLDTGLALARKIQDEEEAVIRVGTVYSMQGRDWANAMSEFSAQQTHVPKITIEQAYSSRLIPRLRKGELDVVFCARMDDMDDLDYKLVWSQPLVLGVHKNNPIANREQITIADLMDYEIMTYPIDSPVKRIDELLPVNDMHLIREYDDEITMSTIITGDENKMAMFCHSFLVYAFEDVVCRRIMDLPIDFHKVYLVTRKEPHSKIINDYISFMSNYTFPNIIETDKVR